MESDAKLSLRDTTMTWKSFLEVSKVNLCEREKIYTTANLVGLGFNEGQAKVRLQQPNNPV